MHNLSSLSAATVPLLFSSIFFLTAEKGSHNDKFSHLTRIGKTVLLIHAQSEGQEVVGKRNTHPLTHKKHLRGCLRVLYNGWFNQHLCWHVRVVGFPVLVLPKNGMSVFKKGWIKRAVATRSVFFFYTADVTYLLWGMMRTNDHSIESRHDAYQGNYKTCYSHRKFAVGIVSE